MSAKNKRQKVTNASKVVEKGELIRTVDGNLGIDLLYFLDRICKTFLPKLLQ